MYCVGTSTEVRYNLWLDGGGPLLGGSVIGGSTVSDCALLTGFLSWFTLPSLWLTSLTVISALNGHLR